MHGLIKEGGKRKERMWEEGIGRVHRGKEKNIYHGYTMFQNPSSLPPNYFCYIYSLCVCVFTHSCQRTHHSACMEVRGPLAGVGFPLPPYRSLGVVASAFTCWASFQPPHFIDEETKFRESVSHSQRLSPYTLWLSPLLPVFSQTQASIKCRQWLHYSRGNWSQTVRCSPQNSWFLPPTLAPSTWSLFHMDWFLFLHLLHTQITDESIDYTSHYSE